MASAVFRDGLAGVLTFGSVIAARSFGFDVTEVIVFAIAANLVAGFTTIFVGMFQDRIGEKRIMVWSLLLMIICTLTLTLLDVHGAWVFWVFGLVLCTFVGPVYSASRSFLVRLIPPGREGEIFGLYATTGRIGSFLSPLAFTMTVTLGGDASSGTIGLALVLALGLGLLLAVRDPKRSSSS